MADVMHQDGGLYGLRLAVEDELSFLLQGEQRLAHQVIGTQRVLESSVSCAGIDHRGQSQLTDACETLEERVLHDVVEQAARYADEPEDGVVDDKYDELESFHSNVISIIQGDDYDILGADEFPKAKDNNNQDEISNNKNSLNITKKSTWNDLCEAYGLTKVKRRIVVDNTKTIV